jgi:hypothetical protein
VFNLLLAGTVLIVLLGLLSLSVVCGRMYGRNQIKKHADKQLEVVIVAEGAVFTLLALLVAFAFSGAYDRFESRKMHIIEEANAVDTAYKRIGLLTPETQEGLRDNFRKYLDGHLQMYKNVANFKLLRHQIEDSLLLEDQIWNQALAACKVTNDSSATQLLLPAINSMFDAENTGIEITRIHPPAAIFELLIGLAILSGLLAGYSTADSKSRMSLHILSYITITAFTIFIIINLEFPRLGVIRVDAFDRILTTVRDHMQ